MVKQVIKELAVLIALITAIGTAFYLLLDGVDPLSDGTFDINIHDTYFVIGHLYLTLPIVVLGVFIIYLTRMFLNSFMNAFVNIIFILSSIILLYGIVVLIAAVTSSVVSPGESHYSYLRGRYEIKEANVFYYINLVLKTYFLLLLSLLIYCAYKMGRVRKIDR